MPLVQPVSSHELNRAAPILFYELRNLSVRGYGLNRDDALCAHRALSLFRVCQIDFVRPCRGCGSAVLPPTPFAPEHENETPGRIEPYRARSGAPHPWE